MKQLFVNNKRRLLHTVLSIILVGLLYFVINFIQVRAAANNWIGGASGDWNVAGNWSDGVPTSDDVISVVPTSTGIHITIQDGTSAEFNSFAIGGDATYWVTTTLLGDLDSGSGDLTINQNGIFEQQHKLTQQIAGDLTVAEDGILTHSQNTDQYVSGLSIIAANIYINAGGMVVVDGSGYSGAGKFADGFGTSGGTIGNGGSYNRGGGGGHGGHGGDAWASIESGIGGASYCDINNPFTPGSQGGGGGSYFSNDFIGGAGGGVIQLQASGDIVINGEISANGISAQSTGDGGDAGGGAGGSIYLAADNISGAPSAPISVRGGSSIDNLSQESLGGGGGGGCIYVDYTTELLINRTSFVAEGGQGAQRGGAGFVYIKQNTQDGDLYLINGGTNASSTPAVSTQFVDMTVDSVTVASSTTFVLGDSKSLTINDSLAFASSTNSSIIRVMGGTLNIPDTVTVQDVDFEIWQGASIPNASTLDLTIDNGALLDLHQFTTSSALSINSLTVNSGGTVTHGANTTTANNFLNIAANDITINSGGIVDVSQKGYQGGVYATDGSGIGPGVYAVDGGAAGGSGGAHAGDGGDAGINSIIEGGTAYCNTSSPATLGSGGGGGGSSDISGGDGGGYVKLSAVNTLQVAGFILANGGDGIEDGDRDGGGGAGGGVFLTANAVDIGGSLISTNGGDGGTTPFNFGGGGGGGCIYIYYDATYNDSSSVLYYDAGDGQSATGTVALAGTFNLAAGNTVPALTLIQSPNFSYTSSGLYFVSSTLIDVDNDSVNIYIDYSTNTGASWAALDVLDVTNTSTVTAASFTTATGAIYFDANTSDYQNFTLNWDASAVMTSSTETAYIRMRGYDGVNYSNYLQTDLFTVDVDVPTAPGGLSLLTVEPTMVTLGYPTVTSSDANFAGYEIYYSTTTPVSRSSAQHVDVNTSDASFFGATTTTVSGLDINEKYFFEIFAVDSFENYSSSTFATSTYTAVMPVPSTTIAAVSSTALSYTLETAQNPSSTEYAIYNDTDAMYIDSFGMPTSTAVYQVSSSWSGIYVEGLTPNEQYQISVYNRNGDGW